MTKPFAGKETNWRWEPRWEQENEETLKVLTFIDILFCIDIVGKNHKTKYLKDILCSNTQIWYFQSLILWLFLWKFKYITEADIQKILSKFEI